MKPIHPRDRAYLWSLALLPWLFALVVALASALAAWWKGDGNYPLEIRNRYDSIFLWINFQQVPSGLHLFLASLRWGWPCHTF